MTRPVSSWKRLLPTSLATRLTLLVVVLLIVALWMSAAVYMRDRAETAFGLLSSSVAARIAAIVPLMEDTAPVRRQQLLLALDSPTLRVGLTPDAVPAGEAGWTADFRHHENLRDLLPTMEGREITIRSHRRWHKRGNRPSSVPGGVKRHDSHGRERPVRNEPRVPGRSATPPDLLESRMKVLISVTLRSGGWMHFVASTDSTSLVWALRMVLWLTGATVVILILTFWGARRMTRPLRRFAEASERIGLDIRSPPLPESGPGELRRAVRTFNGMQGRLRRLIDDRTMMLAAIGHDLRTLLTRLTLRAEFIGDDEQRDKAAADIREMTAMLDSTLAFARDDFDHVPRTLLDLVPLLRDLCEEANDAGQTVSCVLPEQCELVCAPLQIKRALRNIIDNALRYGSEARITLTESGEEVSIDIADRGPGIASDRKADVFRPFFRLESSRSRETGGTGLGLAVARSIIRRHGGDIALLDRQGGGLVVRVTIPFANTDDLSR